MHVCVFLCVRCAFVYVVDGKKESGVCCVYSHTVLVLLGPKTTALDIHETRMYAVQYNIVCERVQFTKFIHEQLVCVFVLFFSVVLCVRAYD